MSCAKHSRLYCKECFPLLSVDEPQAEMQQKGEKMPTFEPTVKEIIAEMYKRFGHLLGAREIDEFAHDFGRPPAASEERGLREIARLCAEDVNAINFNRRHMLKDEAGNEAHVMPTEEMAQVIEWRLNAALQSVPSSPRPPCPNCSTPMYIGELERNWGMFYCPKCNKHMKAAEPSDAGQPRCTTCWALLPCKVHQPQPRTCQEEQD